MALDPLTAVLDVGGKLIDRLWPDPTEKAKAQLALLQLQQAGELQQIVGQLEVNKVEAASASIFVAGWRPFIGWICGCALISDLIVRPLFSWAAALLSHAVAYPALDMSTLLTLLGGMLGFGAMRSFDKAKGTDNGH